MPANLEGASRRVLRRALICIRHLRHELDAMRSAYAEREDLPGLRSLVDAMSALLAEAEREVILLSRALDKALDAGRPAGEEEERFAGQANGLVDALDRVFPKLLAMIRNPHGREIEALFAPFTDLVARLHQSEPRSIELILVPDEEYSYELSVIDKLASLAQRFDTDDLHGLLYSGFPRLVAVTYPKQREADVLIHMMIAHEIAHTVLGLAPPDAEEAPIIAAFDRATSEHFAAMLDRFGGEGEEAERKLRANEAIARIESWFDELACDALALAMIGPAYVFALADFDLTPNNYVQVPDTAGFETHPGLALRLRLAIERSRQEYLPAGPFGPATEALSEGMDGLLAELPDAEEELSDEERALLAGALSNLTPQVVADVLNQARYLSAYFAEEVELVWEKLSARIPPAERIGLRGEHAPAIGSLAELPREWSSPMEWQSIVNGCFAWWLAERPLRDDDGRRTFPDRRHVAQDWIGFNSFVRGSVELVNLHRALQESSNRLEGLNIPA